MRQAIILAALLLCRLLPATAAERVPTPYDAVVWSYADAAENAERAANYRYVLCLENTPEDLAANCYVYSSTLSHSPLPFIPLTPVAGTNRYLVRIDLSKLAPFKEDRIRLAAVWERMAIQNYYFHSINPKFVGTETKRQAADVDVVFQVFFRFADGHTAWTNCEFVRRRSDKVDILYRGNAGEVPLEHTRWWNTRTKQIVEQPRRRTEVSDLAYLPALHLAGPNNDGLHLYRRLCLITGSDTPIVRDDQLLSLLLRQKKGGLYYASRLIDRGTNGKTDEEAWIESIGGDAEAIKNLHTEERAAMWRRRLNEQPAAFEWFITGGTRASIGPGVAFLTRDFVRRETDATRHPLYNVLNYKHDATEGFGMLPNGMIEFVLFDGQGNLQEVAPPDVALDTSLATEHVHHAVEIEVGHSCIRCHAVNDMYHPLENHVRMALDSRIDIFDDEDSDRDREETLVEIASKYGGDPMEAVRIARMTHAKATYIVTGGIFERDSVRKAATKVSEKFNRYYYDPVTPRQAALELGWKCRDDAEAQKLLHRLVPTLPQNDLGFSPETPALRTIKFWREGTQALPKREDWEREYSVLMTRVLNARIKSESDVQAEEELP